MKVCDHIKGCRHAKNNYLSGRTDVGFSALTRSAAFFGEFAFISVLFFLSQPPSNPGL